MRILEGDSLLAARIDQEASDLRRVDSALASLTDGPHDHEASTAVRDRFQLLIQQKTRYLREIGDGSNGTPDWQRLAGALADISPIKREALAFIEGTLLRRSRLDAGVGEVAERLLLGLARRSAIPREVLVSVDVGEFLDHTVSMIRVRFPDTSVWGLPLLAHELGHHVAATLQHADPRLREQSRPVAAYLTTESSREATASERKVELSRLHELFADAYATYSLGASYPAAAVALRAWPDDSAWSSTHPPWSRRVWTMIATLRAMSEIADDGPRRPEYRLMADHHIEPLWYRIAGKTTPEDSVMRLVDKQSRNMVDLLHQHTPPRLRYDPLGPVHRLIAVLEAGAEEVPNGATIAHVLQAAWLWRLEHWGVERHTTDQVSDNALSLCRLAAP
ncbi:hypothetical protein ACFV9D_16150 [Streptomyces sp. NPDC059875]|uniref:hypothetical protein n=1 Tax=unclassified Streptomyces TaxID=2593676 RepID=UPI0036683406